MEVGFVGTDVAYLAVPRWSFRWWRRYQCPHARPLPLLFQRPFRLPQPRTRHRPPGRHTFSEEGVGRRGGGRVVAPLTPEAGSGERTVDTERPSIKGEWVHIVSRHPVPPKSLSIPGLASRCRAVLMMVNKGGRGGSRRRKRSDVKRRDRERRRKRGNSTSALAPLYTPRVYLLQEILPLSLRTSTVTLLCGDPLSGCGLTTDSRGGRRKDVCLSIMPLGRAGSRRLGERRQVGRRRKLCRSNSVRICRHAQLSLGRGVCTPSRSVSAAPLAWRKRLREKR